jgi:hypothetical protein
MVSVGVPAGTGFLVINPGAFTPGATLGGEGKGPLGIPAETGGTGVGRAVIGGVGTGVLTPVTVSLPRGPVSVLGDLTDTGVLGGGDTG